MAMRMKTWDISNYFRSLIALAAVMLLASCGGGSANSRSTTPSVTTYAPITQRAVLDFPEFTGTAGNAELQAAASAFNASVLDEFRQSELLPRLILEENLPRSVASEPTLLLRYQIQQMTMSDNHRGTVFHVNYQGRMTVRATLAVYRVEDVAITQVTRGRVVGNAYDTSSVQPVERVSLSVGVEVDRSSFGGAEGWHRQTELLARRALRALIRDSEAAIRRAVAAGSAPAGPSTW